MNFFSGFRADEEQRRKVRIHQRHRQMWGAGGGGEGTFPGIANSEFYAPLTHSLILTRGSGNPTYTRATAAWEFDNEGKLITVPSGAGRFGGARMVRNLVPASEVFTGASWTKAQLTVPSANLIVCENSSVGFQALYWAGATINTGERMLIRYRVQYVDIRYVQIWFNGARFPAGAYVNFDLVDGDYTAGADATVTMTQVSPGIWDITCSAVSTSAGVAYAALGLINSQSASGAAAFTGDGIKSVGVLQAQFENVTGQADQTASEYVSVGVLSAPYHGAGVDGVKYFNTNKDGSAISSASLLGYHAEGARTNNLLYSRNLGGTNLDGVVYWVPSTLATEIVVNGSFGADASWTKAATVSISGGLLHFTASAANDGAAQGPALKDNTTYKVTYTVSNYTSGGCRVFLYGATTGHSGGTPAVTANGTYTSYIRTATSGSATNYLKIFATSAGTTLDVDDLSVVEESMQVTTCTGIDNAPNSASTLTAGAADATILQTISMASAARSSSAYVKRRTGSGNIYFTRDGGTTWTDITASVGASWTRVKIENTSVLNPVVGFKIATSGDAIDVDVVQDEAGAFISSPIITTTAAVTRNADVLSYETASNWNNTNGAAAIKVNSFGGFIVNERLIYLTNGLYAHTSYSGGYLHDGTTYVNGPAGSPPAGVLKSAFTWASATQKLCISGGSVTSGAYDGSYGAGIAINIGNGRSYLRDIYIWQSALTDAQLQQVTT